MLKAAKSADHKLFFVPLLLLLGRSFGIARFVVNIASNLTWKPHLPAWDKALFTLEVGIVALEVFCTLGELLSLIIENNYLVMKSLFLSDYVSFLQMYINCC